MRSGRPADARVLPNLAAFRYEPIKIRGEAYFPGRPRPVYHICPKHPNLANI